jgi:crossover junction endodeoxyribonuclease RuvC
MLKKPIKLIGVDPGTNLLGYAVLEITGDQLRILDIGTINLNKVKDHQTKLREIYLQLQEIIETYLPGEMAIEAPFYHKNPQSMLKLGRAQGVAIAAGITMGLKITEYSPKKIKQAITGNGNSSKEQVAAMLSHILQKPIPHQSLDASDALAVALCHHYQSGFSNTPKRYSNWKKFLSENPKRAKK